jgi:hypothetical protein
MFVLKDTERLLSSNHTLRLMSQDVETHRLAQGTTLSDGNDITFLDGECGTAVHCNVLVTLFESTVLSNEMQVVSSDHNRSLHLGGNDQSLENTSTDGNVSSEGALLVDVVAFNGRRGRLDAETYGFEPTHGFAVGTTNGTLASHKDGILFLVSFFVLITLNIFTGDARHGCCCCCFDLIDYGGKTKCRNERR